MANIRTLRSSFVGGELAPEMMGRVDFDKFQAGLALCQNFCVTPQGAVQNRAGTLFGGVAKLAGAAVVRMIPFSFNNSQTFAIELGAGYFRFWSLGEVLLSAGVPYEVANSYAAGDLFDIHYVQSGDVVTLVHPGYPPMELRRYGATNWTLAPITFSSSLVPPAGVSAVTTIVATPTVSQYGQNYQYQITALDQYGDEESLPSTATTTVGIDLTFESNYVTVSWAMPVQPNGTSTGYFNVYKSVNGGGFGFVAQMSAQTLSFTDKNVTPDMTQTPPMYDAALNSADNYPGAVAYYEERRIFGGTNNQPMNFWATQPGTANNMNYSVPSQSSDALRVGIQAARSSEILHIVGEQDLIILTASDEWRVYTASGDALTPSTLAIKKQQSNGSTNVMPALIQNQLLYTTAACGHIRSLIYDWQLNGYRSDDLSLLAQHLFRNHSIVDMAYSRWAPYPTLWVVRDDGVLLGLTFEPGQQVAAWHQHVTTNGAFESVCCVQEGNFDVLYGVVRRTIGGVTTRYIEKMDTRAYGANLAAAVFVDSGITQTFSSPVMSVSGLTWLEGQMVSALLDGKAVTGLVVSSAGAVTLPFAASVVTIGLPITATLQTLPVTVAQDASAGLGHVKNVCKIWARVVDFCGCQVGPAGGGLVKVAPLAVDGNGNPTMAMGEFRCVPMPNMGTDGAMVVEQALPLPLTVCDLVLEVAVGG